MGPDELDSFAQRVGPRLTGRPPQGNLARQHGHADVAMVAKVYGYRRGYLIRGA